ncbi:helix-turn-helix domain-containing protein [Microbacterium sp. P07]|uniref:helix-turn-helix domain-containing protein n=1 Tax=Microbacterium sp. P07 TaxID=3366952 RepID=UPI003746A7CF
MAANGPLSEFLTARREQLQPEVVGLQRERGRRVAGLRRSEVADLAGISVDYYLRLEQGRDRQPSTQVLAALSRALRLDRVADTYLHRIVQSSGGRRRAPQPATLEDAESILRTWGDAPAYITDAHHDIVAVNRAAVAVAPDHLCTGRNLLLNVFAGSESAHNDEMWNDTARLLVAALRYQSDPSSPRLREILGTLSVEHRKFRQLWSRHEAFPQTTGTTKSNIAGHGWVDLRWRTLDVPGEVGHFVTTLYADAGSPGAAALASIRDDAGYVPALRPLSMIDASASSFSALSESTPNKSIKASA